MSLFKLGMKVIVRRNISTSAEEKGYGSNKNYPQIGMTGKLVDTGCLDGEWEIEWDNQEDYPSEDGWLVREWMIKPVDTEWDEETNL